MKRIISILFALLLVLNIPFSVSASSYYPTILTPIQYDEVPHRDNINVTWSAPTAGTVTKYLISLRHLKYQDNVIDDLMIHQEEIAANERSYIVSRDMIMESSFFRVALGAVNSNGNTYWSEQLFYVSANRGVHNRTISFKIYTGFSTEIKDAIYYSTRTWINATGVERVNTYSYSNGVSSSALIKEDGVNTIVPYTDHLDNRLMVTITQRDYSYNAEEVDIIINRAFLWSVDSQSGYYNVQNVMTHEIGHAHGLCDKYETFATEWTMYGSAESGETKKKTLTANDLQSLSRLYS